MWHEAFSLPRKGLNVCFLLSVTLLFSPAPAEAKPPSVSVQVSRDTVTVGDEIIYEIRVTHGPETRVDFPKEEANFSPFELKRYRPLPRKESGQKITEGVRYVLTVFQLGQRKIPAQTLFYTDFASPALPKPDFPSRRLEEGTGVRKALTTDPLPIQVKSVLGKTVPSTLDIQRLKKPEEAPFQTLFKRVGLLLLAVGGLSLGIYGLIRFLPKPVPRRVREDPVGDALNRMGELEKTLGRESATRAHYEILSGILRRYLAKQYDPLTQDLTTSELHDRMVHYRPCRAVAEGAHQILSVSDLVKFSDRAASEKELLAFLRTAEEIIRHAALPPAIPEAP